MLFNIEWKMNEVSNTYDDLELLTTIAKATTTENSIHEVNQE